jgi:hypothetical protein
MPSLIDGFGFHIVRNVYDKLMWILCFIFLEFHWKFSYLNCWIWSWNKEHHWCEMLMFFFWIFMEPFFLELLLLWTCDKGHHLSTKEGCLFVCLSNWNQNASCYAFSTVGKPLMNKGAPTTFFRNAGLRAQWSIFLCDARDHRQILYSRWTS